jgi:enterochelin esterase-like enzyme
VPADGPTASAGSPVARLNPDTWTALPWSSKAEWPTRGAIVATTLGGNRSGLSEPAWVYLPPAYFTDAARDLPIAEVLTGYPGHQKNLVERMHYPDLLLEGIRSGQARPMVLVMMRPVPTYPWDTECTDLPGGGPQAFTFFAEDVPTAAAAAFGLRPTGYAMVGDSTGAYCAAKVAMMAPQRFSAAVAMSGYFHAATDRSTRGIFSNQPDLRDQNDLRWRLRHLPAPRTSILVATSADAPGNDGFQAAEEFVHLARPPLSVDEQVLDHGGHNFETWLRQIPYALSWLSRHLPGAETAGLASPSPAPGSLN